MVLLAHLRSASAGRPEICALRSQSEDNRRARGGRCHWQAQAQPKAIMQPAHLSFQQLASCPRLRLSCSGLLLLPCSPPRCAQPRHSPRLPESLWSLSAVRMVSKRARLRHPQDHWQGVARTPKMAQFRSCSPAPTPRQSPRLRDLPQPVRRLQGAAVYHRLGQRAKTALCAWRR